MSLVEHHREPNSKKEQNLETKKTNFTDANFLCTVFFAAASGLSEIFE
jgi:hypothetical protein